MSITLNIPESVVRSLRVPEGEVEDRLRMEFAVTVYAQELLSFGRAAELANMTRFQFADLVTQRGIPRHYGPEELAEDLAYANGE
jgi:predicted HTH domain antitoxin